MEEITYLIGGDVLALVVVDEIEALESFEKFLDDSGYQYRIVDEDYNGPFSQAAGERIAEEYYNMIDGIDNGEMQPQTI